MGQIINGYTVFNFRAKLSGNKDVSELDLKPDQGVQVVTLIINQATPIREKLTAVIEATDSKKQFTVKVGDTFEIELKGAENKTKNYEFKVLDINVNPPSVLLQEAGRDGNKYRFIARRVTYEQTNTKK